MKSKILFYFVYIAALFVTVFNVFFSIKNYLLPDINDLPKGELIQSVDSPSGKKKVNVYLVKNSMGEAIRAELTDKLGKADAKNIFWQTEMSNVNITWKIDGVIYFDNIPISGTGEMPYDCRKGTSLFTDGALANELIKEANRYE